MWGWIAAAAALCAIVIASVNLDFIRKADTVVDAHLHSLVATVPLETMNAATSTLDLSSPAFENGGTIPLAYTCDASSTSIMNPPLSISGVPKETASLALIVDDPDVPKQLVPSGVFDHWVLFNIPATTTAIAEGASAGVPGANGAGAAAYYPPCPPKQYEPAQHRYVFKLYALDAMLDLSANASSTQVMEAMQGHIIAQTQLMGLYERQ